MEHELLVYASCADGPRSAGHLWTRQRKESASLEYDRAWLADPLSALMLTGAGRALFGAIGGSAPDRWSRILMRRAERHRAQEEDTIPRTLSEADYCSPSTRHAGAGMPARCASVSATASHCTTRSSSVFRGKHGGIGPGAAQSSPACSPRSSIATMPPPRWSSRSLSSSTSA